MSAIRVISSWEAAYDELDSDDEFMADENDDQPDGISTNAPTHSEIKMCIVCEDRPVYSKVGKSYPTCGLKCAAVLDAARNIVSSTTKVTPISAAYRGPGAISTSTTIPTHKPSNVAALKSQRAKLLLRQRSLAGNPVPEKLASSSTKTNIAIPPSSSQNDVVNVLEMCVVCLLKPCPDGRYVTCGIACAERLCTSGSANLNNCDYCHRRPKLPGHTQCGTACSNSAKLACLLCKCRPKLNRYQLCGKTCRTIAIKRTPMILEAPPGHDTYEMVARKFKAAWSSPPGGTCPPIRHIYKVIEDKNFLQPYDRYKKSVGNEVFRYHGTKKQCNLGELSQKKLCSSISCALCSILRTSFKTTLANPSGAFGPGIYSSSASNKAFNYTNNGSKGAIILAKVILGKVRHVNNWNEVMSAPPGFDSVVKSITSALMNDL